MSEFFDLEKRREILGLRPGCSLHSFTPENVREEALKQWIFSLEFDNEALTLEAHPHFDWGQEDVVKARRNLIAVMEQTKDTTPEVCSAFLECYSLLGALSSALRDNDALRVVLEDFLNERGHSAQSRAYTAQGKTNL